MILFLSLVAARALAAPVEERAPSAPSATAAPAAPTKSAGTSGSGDPVRAIVHLRDGGLLRGTVKRLRLGKSITLTTPSGKAVTLDDEDIVSVELFGRGAPAGAGSDASAPAPASPPAAAPPKGADQAGAAVPAKSSLGPLPQRAPRAQLDTVYLADGGLLRGTIEAEKPALVVRLVSGRVRTLPPGEVKRVARGGQEAPGEGIDTAFLKDGSVLRGAIESEKPELVIRLVSGRKRTVPAAAVDRVERGRKP